MNDLTHLRQAASKGDTKAQMSIALAYRPAAAANGLLAVCWFRQAAAQGESLAQLELAVAYGSGAVVPANPVRAVSWLRRAAGQGNRNAIGLLEEGWPLN